MCCYSPRRTGGVAKELRMTWCVGANGGFAKGRKRYGEERVDF